jgi:hypothetical protein
MKDDTVRRLEALVLELDEVEAAAEVSVEARREEPESAGGRSAA